MDSDQKQIMIIVAVVVAVTLVVIAAVTQLGRYGPDFFVGDRPHAAHPIDCDPAGRGCSENLRYVRLTWTLAAGRATWTRLSVAGHDGPEVFGEASGTLALDNADDCPVTVDWEFTPVPPAPPWSGAPLRGDDEVDVGRLPVPDGTRELIVRLRRVDALLCTAQVTWSQASLK